MSIRLYVGNLPKEDVDRDELHAVFAEFGEAVSTKVIKDRKTGKCRGFAFVTVPTDELADEIIEKFNGQAFKETELKIEKALPRSKNQEEDEAAPRPAASSNAPAPVRRSSGGGSKKSSKRGSGASTTTTTSSSDSGAIQPDPRWAADLERLKELLAAQATPNP
ncbi:MAG TPA: RNA-binding protein [Candidatus Sericytochromatia bacterium]